MNARRKLEEQLSSFEAPAPPPDLAAKILAEMPARLTLAPELQEPELAPVVRPRFGGFTARRMALAASVLVAVGAAVVVFQVRERSPQRAELAKESAVGARLADREVPLASAEGQALQEQPSAGAVSAEPAQAPAVAPIPAAPPPPALAVPKPQAVAPEELAQLGYLGSAPSASQSEAKRQDPWATLQAKPGVVVERINVGGNEAGGGVEGGVVGSVRGGAPGGVPAGVPSASLARPSSVPPSTGGTAEPNDQPYGDVFFKEYGVNPFLDTEEDRLSTFAIEVDTGGYGVVRRYLSDGHRPPGEAVRVEEMLNAFDYHDAPPESGDFRLIAQGAPSPFTPGERYRLLRFAVKGREINAADRAPAVLTFVVDVSGSMDQENRLGLVKKALGLLVDQLRGEDRVGLVVYGSEARVVLNHTSNRQTLRDALEKLVPDGATNAEEGLRLAYDLASAARRESNEGAIHRVILCSDGVANVGATGPESILTRIGDEARRGIELTTVGFGMGNYNDVLMEQLADRGNGRYAYVDNLREARRIFVENLTGTLQTIAKDAKVQVEFDPKTVSRYRLIGYENRDVADNRFRDDSVDAGEIGAGHTATALYEVKLKEAVSPHAVVGTLRLRYHSVAQGRVVEVAEPLFVRDLAASFEAADKRLRLAAVVAELGEILKGSYWARGSELGVLLARAQQVSAEWPGEAQVAELAALVARAKEASEP